MTIFIRCVSRAGRVKGITDYLLRNKPLQEEKKKPKTGRAKRRAQYKNRILAGHLPSNEAPAPTGTHFNHRKIPKFIDQSFSGADKLQNWQSTVSSQNANPNPYRKRSKIAKKECKFIYMIPSGSKVRSQSHPQKTKGSTGKVIQRDRNEAAKVKLHTALYGTECE